MAYRANRNGSSGPPVAGSYDNQSMFLEQQNDALADDLASKVNHLKRVTIAIGDEVRSQNSLIDQVRYFNTFFNLCFIDGLRF
jgi:uncharacterized protein YoxC